MINTGISFVLECITHHRISNIMLVYLFSLSYGDLRPILYEECNDINMNSIWFFHTANLSCALQYITGNYHISYKGSLFFLKIILKIKYQILAHVQGGQVGYDPSVHSAHTKLTASMWRSEAGKQMWASNDNKNNGWQEQPLDASEAGSEPRPSVPLTPPSASDLSAVVSPLHRTHTKQTNTETTAFVSRACGVIICYITTSARRAPLYFNGRDANKCLAATPAPTGRVFRGDKTCGPRCEVAGSGRMVV